MLQFDPNTFYKGQVKSFNIARHYGFISHQRDDGALVEIFFHGSAFLDKEVKGVAPETFVKYKVKPAPERPEGQYMAYEIEIISKADQNSPEIAG